MSDHLFGEIDIHKKLPELELFLCKPNLKTIGNLSESAGKNLNLKLSQINEIKFWIPYEIEVNQNLVKNPNIDKVKQRFVVRVQLGDYKENYMIKSINKVMDNDRDYKEVTAFLLPYELADKNIRIMEEMTANIEVISNKVLSTSVWSIGHIDLELLNRFRKFEFSSITVLDAIFKIAETFEALIVWDTFNRKINFYHPDNLGKNKGLFFDYGRYLESLNQDEQSDEMTTQLSIYGHDGLSINSINPSGTSYIEDYSYFLYPFQRDENKNTIQSSDYMSDELCHAILDYQELVQSKQGIFAQLLHDKRVVQTNLISKEVELFMLETELKLIEDLVLMRQSNNAYHAYENSVGEFPYDFYTRTNTTRKYAVMAKADKNVTFTVNFQDVALQSNMWHVFKFENLTEIQGIFQTTDLPYYFTCIVVEISEQEFSQVENQYALLDKYNQYAKQSQVNSKQLEVFDIEEEIQIINSSIEQLQQDISIENNFTPELIIEKNIYEIHKEWTDDNIIDVEELLELGKKVLEDLRRPKKILNISVVNFLKFIESQKDWNKLVLADKVTVRQNKFNINSQSRIIGIGIDFDSDSINLTIADTTDVETDEDKLIKMIYQSGSTSATVNMKKNKWDEVGQVKNSVSELLNNTWDASTRAINAGTNNSVTVDRRGLTIKDPDDPMKFLRGINSVLGITRDGGLTFEHAITADGIIGRQIIGEILIGQNLFMENESGTFMFDKDGVSIVGAAFNVIGGLPASEIDPRYGDVIDISNNNVITSIANNLNEIDGIVSLQTTAIQQNAEQISLAASKQSLEGIEEELAELKIRSDEISFNFSSGGGVNLLKNSVGFAGTDFWNVTGNVQTRRNGELIDRGSGSGFVLREGKIAQSVLTRNQQYTISTLVKKTSDGSGYFRVYNGDEVVNIQFNIGTSYDYEPFEITISPQSSQIVVEFFGDGLNEVTFTSIMANVGENPLQWSHSEGEMYNSNVLMDINGIRVLSSTHDGYTAITPEEFAGYYDTNGDGQHEKVFYLDKDETVSKKFQAQEEFTMGTIKIIKLESAGNNGWAFVPTTD